MNGHSSGASINEPTGGKIDNLQALRGVAIIMVMLCHIGVYEERIFSAGALLPSLTYTGRAGVDLFFVISGFLMVTITYHRPAAHAPAAFLLRRILRIYPLYWIYTLIYLPIFLLSPGMLTRPDSGSEIELWHSFLLLPSKGGLLVGQGWTLIHEMYFYLVFALLLLRPRRELFGWLICWAGVITVAWISLPNPFVATSVKSVLLNPLTLEFLAGCGVAWLIKKQITAGAIPAILLGAGLFVATAFLVPQGPRALIYLLPGSLLVYGAIAAEKRGAYRFPRWLRYVGDISYSIYLSHIMALFLVKKIFMTFGFHTGEAANLSFIFVAAIACLALGAMSYHFIERPLLKFLRTFLQRRREMDFPAENRRTSVPEIS